MILHALTIFLSAFLLFSVQPVITKQILPIFGGSTSVWLLSLVFFQLLLLFGYIYSHLITFKLSNKKRILLHISLLCLSLLTLPITYNKHNFSIENEYLEILIMLATTVGVPYFLLSTTAPLVQAFFTKRYPNAKVYRLYALSNLSSMIALFSYPLFFEQMLSIENQSIAWSISYLVFVGVAIGLLSWSFHLKNKNEVVLSLPIIQNKTKTMWLLYSFLGSSLLSAVTAHITQNVASIPLLWILPLAVYLIAFIIAFDYPKLFDKNFLQLFLFILIPFMCFSVFWIFTKNGIKQEMLDIETSIFIYVTGLFMCVFYLNGLLYSKKPEPQQLTTFYVYIALGGLLGSFFVAIIAPLLFDHFIEMQLLLTLLMLLIVFQYKNKNFPLIFLIITIFINSAVYLGTTKSTISAKRGFYGALSVNEIDTNVIKTRYMLHGSILHGMQILNDKEIIPSTYYHQNSGFGKSVALLQKENKKIAIGMVGMGVGTVSIYARPGDTVTFFEIDPLVPLIALEDFSYVSKSQGHIDYKIGDGRILLAKEPNHLLDLLAIDAFSGDSIPIHLLTKEAMQMYMDKINSNGILAFHISSGYVRLEIPLAKIAQQLNLQYGIIEVPNGNDSLQTSSKWVLISKRVNFSNQLSMSLVDNLLLKKQNLWTDNYSNILEVFMH